MITDEYPHVDAVSPPPILLLANCYNHLREEALRMESLLARVAALQFEAEDGNYKLPAIVAEARAILNLEA